MSKYALEDKKLWVVPGAWNRYGFMGKDKTLYCLSIQSAEARYRHAILYEKFIKCL